MSWCLVGSEMCIRDSYQDACVFPGDIIQFENVKAKYVENGVSYQEIMLHHTAIIQKVMDKNRFILIHQNYQSKKKVVTSHFDIQTMTQGKIEIFRPTVSEK
jgi:hypothetical protein